MNIILNLLTFTLFNYSSPAVINNIDTSEEQEKVESAVVNWANTIFLKHEDYKFEHFKAFYTDEYSIQTLRIEMYTEKVEDLKKKKEKGDYKGTDEQFESDISKLEKVIEKAKESIQNIDRVTHYQTHFWTNIQTRDGITVYYELIVKVDNDYLVVEAIENSSIGKQGAASGIAYKRHVELPKVIEKQPKN